MRVHACTSGFRIGGIENRLIPYEPVFLYHVHTAIQREWQSWRNCLIDPDLDYVTTAGGQL